MPTNGSLQLGSHTINSGQYLSGGIVKILVGPDSIAFEIHRQLLCAYSKYFTKLLSDLEEQSNQCLQLPEDDAYLFRLLVHWLYAKNVDQPQLSTRNNEIKASIRLYVLAEKLQIKTPAETSGFTFCTAEDSFLGVIRSEMAWKGAPLSCEDVAYIYDNTPASSPLRQFAIRMIRYRLSKLEVSIEEYRQLFQKHVDFSMDLCKRLLDNATPPDKSEDPLNIFSTIFRPFNSDHVKGNSAAPAFSFPSANPPTAAPLFPTQPSRSFEGPASASEAPSTGSRSGLFGTSAPSTNPGVSSAAQTQEGVETQSNGQVKTDECDRPRQ